MCLMSNFTSDISDVVYLTSGYLIISTVLQYPYRESANKQNQNAT